MKSGDWQHVEQIFHEALQRDPSQRDAFLREACGSDLGLRHEIDVCWVIMMQGPDSSCGLLRWRRS